MKLLLVNPPSEDIFRHMNIRLAPMGLMTLAAYVRQYGHEVEIRDFQNGQKDALEFDYSPYPVVGITTETTRSRIAQLIAKRAKAAGAFVVMGGPHPGYVPEEVLQSGDVDAIVIGEGEATFLDLLNAREGGRPIDDIPGTASRCNGQVVIAPPRPFIQSLDELPFPARDMVDLQKYKSGRIGDRPLTQLITSRGCTHNCHFCSSSRYWGKKLRWRSPESVIAELEEIYEKYGFRAVAFLDDNFASIPKRLIAICEEIVRRKWDIWWWCLARADHLVRNPDMVAAMARAGCKSVHIGVESASEKSLGDYGKRSSKTVVEQAFALLRENGIEIFASFMIGGLHEDHAATEETIELARRLNCNVAQFSILTPYPGTRLFEQLEDRLRHRDWRRYDTLHLVFRHPCISAFRMYGFLIKANVRFYTRSREARRGFMMAMRRGGVGVRNFARVLRDHLRSGS